MRTARVLARAAAAVGAGYAGYVAWTWLRYGRAGHGGPADPLLDRFLPEYEVRERHERPMPVPAAATFAAAKRMGLRRSPVARAVFALREVPARLIGAPRAPLDERGIVAETLSIGWGILAETPGREIVMGAVTRPWEADVKFEALSPEAFAAFSEPGYVKIAWTLRAEPVGPGRCIFQTETRAVATDRRSRARFRRYWAFLSPGIRLIRRAMLRQLERELARPG